MYNLSLINGTSPDMTFVGVSNTFPWLFPSLLFFEFMLIFLSGSYIQRNRIGVSNIPMWGSVAGLVTTTTSFMWSVIQATIMGSQLTLINLSTVGVCLASTILFVFWFVMSDLE